MNSNSPEVIYIETTNKCNAKCTMCPHEKMTRPLADMCQQTFEKIIAGIIKYDLSETQVFLHKEGEPLCDVNIENRIQYLRKKMPNVKEIGISTNAMLLTKERAERLLDSGLNLIFFSVDGASVETYEKIRVGCNYHIVEENIIYFLERRKEKKSNIRVVMQMLVASFNRHEQRLFRKKWEKYDVEFYFKDIHCYLDGNYSSFEKPNFKCQIHCCTDPFRMLVYYVDGKVGACCWDYNNEYIIGNANEEDMMQLYTGSRITYLREKQKLLDCGEITPCNRCGRIYGEDKISEF